MTSAPAGLNPSYLGILMLRGCVCTHSGFNEPVTLICTELFNSLLFCVTVWRSISSFGISY
jgi:hypothetical protein